MTKDQNQGKCIIKYERCVYKCDVITEWRIQKDGRAEGNAGETMIGFLKNIHILVVKLKIFYLTCFCKNHI